MKMIIKDSRIELIPEEEIDRARLAQIPEGTNEVFVYTTLDGGDDGSQEALVIYIGHISPHLQQHLDESLEERREREAAEKYREEHGLDFEGKPIVYPGDEKPEEGS